MLLAFTQDDFLVFERNVLVMAELTELPTP